MSKNRKSKSTPKKPLVEIPEEEKWRLIRESGLLERFKDAGDQSTSTSSPARAYSASVEPDVPSLAEEILNALMLIMPHTFFLVMMVILVHHQYAKQASFSDIIDKLGSTFPIMAPFMFYTIRHKDKMLTQIALLLLSLGVGPRMIWLVNRGSWLKVIAQCPQFATIWLYTVVQLKLSYALLSLALIGGWSWWTGMKLFP